MSTVCIAACRKTADAEIWCDVVKPTTAEVVAVYRIEPCRRIEIEASGIQNFIERHIAVTG